MLESRRHDPERPLDLMRLRSRSAPARRSSRSLHPPPPAPLAGGGLGPEASRSLRRRGPKGPGFAQRSRRGHPPASARSTRAVPDAARAVAAWLRAFGRTTATDPELAGTPDRVARLWSDNLVDGYRHEPARILARGMPSGTGGLVIVRGLAFHSMCPHHLLPFFGTAAVAYLPQGRVAGFSALGRLVDCFAHRLTLQETIAQQVADALVEHLGAAGSACWLRAEQLCLVAAGRRTGTETIAVAWAGSLRRRSAERRAFLQAVGRDAPRG